MLVSMRMIYPVVTINPRASVQSALELIQKESIHTLPIVDRQGRLLGITTATEIRKRLAEETANHRSGENIFIEEIMQRDVLTVTENTPIEEAARIIDDYNMSALPVTRGNFVVGIIDDKSIIRLLLELTGARSQGIRLTCQIVDTPTHLLELHEEINRLNGRIEAMTVFHPDRSEYQLVTMRITGVEKYELKEQIKHLVAKFIDIR